VIHAWRGTAGCVGASHWHGELPAVTTRLRSHVRPFAGTAERRLRGGGGAVLDSGPADASAQRSTRRAVAAAAPPKVRFDVFGGIEADKSGPGGSPACFFIGHTGVAVAPVHRALIVSGSGKVCPMLTVEATVILAVTTVHRRVDPGESPIQPGGCSGPHRERSFPSPLRPCCRPECHHGIYHPGCGYCRFWIYVRRAG
jgi:hypothetical protein